MSANGFDVVEVVEVAHDAVIGIAMSIGDAATM